MPSVAELATAISRSEAQQYFAAQQNLMNRTDLAERFAQETERPNPEWVITVHDKFWRPTGEPQGFMEASGNAPRNILPAATMKLKGSDPMVEQLMDCKKTLVGVTVETEGLRFPYYVDTHEYEFDKAWTSTSNLLGIWDILNYMLVYPDWFLPLAAQVFSHAWFIGPIVTCIENMIAECAQRMQSGMWDFINGVLSLDFDTRTWFGTMLESNGNMFEMLKTPVYVVRTNPWLDTSPTFARTVRMETCGAVIKDALRAYGVHVEVSLWKVGDPQPDQYANLDQPTYVVTVKDRTQIEGPTKTVLDSSIRTFVDESYSLLGDALDPILNPTGEYVPQGLFIAPVLGVHFDAPWAIMVAPDPERGEKGSVIKCKIVDHTPKGYRHVIGGRSPQWLNDLMNATYAWMIDSISILIGISGIPSDLLSGFLNNAFLAFQEMVHFTRWNDVGPYHPAKEVFHATESAPYNVETEFAFINAFWDSRGWTCAQCTFRNGEVYTLGRDVFNGALISLVYPVGGTGKRRILTDYVEDTPWRIDPRVQDIMVQVGDGKAIESPLAKHQRYITALLEIINVITLAPQSSG